MQKLWFCVVSSLLVSSGWRDTATAPAQLRPFRLMIIRASRGPDALSYESCIRGKIYIVPSDFGNPDAIPPTPATADTLELPWKDDVSYISAVPPGTYKASARSDGPLGWRLELHGTGHRTVIEIHGGSKGVTNTTNTEGCILTAV
jgi:hypothetical protein